jgi:hypothetical protein
MQQGQFGEYNMQLEQRWFRSICIVLAYLLSREIAALVTNSIFAIVICMGVAIAQENLKAVVENAKTAPVVLAPFANGPGFTITNVSQQVVNHLRFGCVEPGTTAGKTVKVRFDLGKHPLDLDFSGPGSQQIVKDYSAEQIICTRRDSAITVLEVVFKDGKKWKLPHQSYDKDYIMDNGSKIKDDLIVIP